MNKIQTYRRGHKVDSPNEGRCKLSVTGNSVPVTSQRCRELAIDIWIRFGRSRGRSGSERTTCSLRNDGYATTH